MQKIIQCLGSAILGIVVSCTSVKKSEIISTDNDGYVENILNEADQNTLVIFDGDEVLITNKDALFHPNNSKICKQIISYLDNKIGKSARVSLLVERRKQHTMKLVNKNFPRVIQNLQAKGVRVLLLTAHNQFKKDYKLAIRRGHKPQKLSVVLDILCTGNELPVKYKDHALTNSRKYKDVRECHIEPDWLLIYRIDENAIYLIRTGTHSDLF